MLVCDLEGEREATNKAELDHALMKRYGSGVNHFQLSLDRSQCLRDSVLRRWVDKFRQDRHRRRGDKTIPLSQQSPEQVFEMLGAYVGDHLFVCATFTLPKSAAISSMIQVRNASICGRARSSRR